MKKSGNKAEEAGKGEAAERSRSGEGSSDINGCVKHSSVWTSFLVRYVVMVRRGNWTIAWPKRETKGLSSGVGAKCDSVLRTRVGTIILGGGRQVGVTKARGVRISFCSGEARRRLIRRKTAILYGVSK